MMLVMTVQLFCLLLILRQVLVSANITCLDKEANDTLISLNCTVSNLDYSIGFTYPVAKRGQAYCVVPYLSETLCDCSCNSKPACNCKITQNISTNTTSLQITGTNLTDMFGWYTCAHGSYKKSIMVTRHVLWLETDVNDERIKLSCTPDELTSRIDFFFPKKDVGHAYCSAPRPGPSKGHCKCSCNAASECNCNITQNIATKATTLTIIGTNLTSIFGWYTCAHGSYKKSKMVTPPVLCLNIEVTDEMIKLSCAPGELKSRIDFVFPNKSLGYAYCIALSPSKSNCTCSCNSSPTCKCYITQDFATKTTTLQIMDTNLNRMFGWYTCAHGSYNKSAMVTKPTCTCRTSIQNYADGVYIAVCTLTMTIAVGISIVSFVFPDIPGRIKKIISRRFCQMADNTASTSFKENNGCATCGVIPICGICLNCKKCYCETCCKQHLNIQGEHRVSQIQHALNSEIEIKCDICLKLAGEFCGTCWEPCCALCAKTHKCPLGEKEMIIIYQNPSISKLDRKESVHEKLNHIDTLSFDVDDDPVRICGVGYLSDGLVVALDANDRKFIVFKSGNEKLKKELHDEPFAMATMTNNQVAVTFPYIMQIRIYTINFKKMENSGEELEYTDIKMSSLRLHKNKKRSLRLHKYKPFSIAYNKGHVAVEVGEGADGMIIIVDINKTVVLESIQCPYAFFTGHTIRLALNITDTDDGLIYVSAMGKKMVTCMNFKGEKVWHRSIPGPRSIIFPEDSSLGEIIIMSSRRCNVIYKINQNTGEEEMLKAQDEINSPRFIAYSNNQNRLCALVQNDQAGTDELAIFEFIEHDENESTHLLVKDTEQQI